MTNNTSHPLLPDAPIGLPSETIMSLSDEARSLYNQIFDYCTYAADPQYQTLHTFRNRIARLADERARAMLITYFNTDPAMQDHNMQTSAWEYYAQPY